jgi:hypothetical protein
MKGASFKAGAGMIQSAFLPVPVLAPVPVLGLELELEPGPEPEPEPPVGAVLAPLALGHSPGLSQGVIAVLASGLQCGWKPPLTSSWRRIACSICSGVYCTPCNGGK